MKFIPVIRSSASDSAKSVNLRMIGSEVFRLNAWTKINDPPHTKYAAENITFKKIKNTSK